jgi:hypothetical protein
MEWLGRSCRVASQTWDNCLVVFLIFFSPTETKVSVLKDTDLLQSSPHQYLLRSLSKKGFQFEDGVEDRLRAKAEALCTNEEQSHS